jgi:hypothetical protein
MTLALKKSEVFFAQFVKGSPFHSGKNLSSYNISNIIALRARQVKLFTIKTQKYSFSRLK